MRVRVAVALRPDLARVFGRNQAILRSPETISVAPFGLINVAKPNDTCYGELKSRDLERTYWERSGT